MGIAILITKVEFVLNTKRDVRADLKVLKNLRFYVILNFKKNCRYNKIINEYLIVK